MTNHALAYQKTGKPFDEKKRLRGSLFQARGLLAEVVVSTAHRSKGREWDRVTLAEDFTGVTLAQENPTHRCVKLYLEEANLTYVAFTRARDTLVKGAFAEALERQKDIARALKAGERQLCTPEIEAQARKTDPRTPGLLGRLWKRLFGG